MQSSAQWHANTFKLTQKCCRLHATYPKSIFNETTKTTTLLCSLWIKIGSNSFMKSTAGHSTLQVLNALWIIFTTRVCTIKLLTSLLVIANVRLGWTDVKTPKYYDKGKPTGAKS
jgi:hypothetical protein